LIKGKFYVNQSDFVLDTNIAIQDEGVTAIFGPSGCGKTTLLRIIAGLDKYPGNQLEVGNEIWQDDKSFIPPHKRPIGYVFQEARLFTHLNVRQNLEYGVKRTAKSVKKITLADSIKLLGIGNLLKRRPDTLSGGEKQRIAIARALALNPEVLLMDEPLSNLDMRRKQEIIPYLENLNQKLNIPIIYVSHATDEVARLADNVALMETGKIVASLSVQEAFSSLNLPLAHSDNAGSIINAKVFGHDTKFNLTYLEFAGGMITITRKNLAQNTKVRLLLAARDISLTLDKQENTSILNIFPALVDKIAEAGPSQVIVRLVTNNVPIISRITKKSAAGLNLTKGKKVFAQVKSVAVL